MKKLLIYEEGETVLIKARISKVFIDKDRVSYVLTDEHNIEFKNRFSSKDIMPYEQEEPQEQEGEVEDGELGNPM